MFCAMCVCVCDLFSGVIFGIAKDTGESLRR